MNSLEDRITRLENYIGDYSKGPTMCDEIKKLEEPFQNQYMKTLLEFCFELDEIQKFHTEAFDGIVVESESDLQKFRQVMKSLVLDGRLESALQDLKLINDNIDRTETEKVEFSVETFGILELFTEFMRFSSEVQSYYQSLSREFLYLASKRKDIV